MDPTTNLFPATAADLITWEGFREKPYQDSLGNWTIGHGLTYLTEAESGVIVAGRVREAFWTAVKQLGWPAFMPLNETRKSVVLQMIFQLGGLLDYPRFCEALTDIKFDLAADEMLWKAPPKNLRWSDWHSQTPIRCETLAVWMRGGERHAMLGV